MAAEHKHNGGENSAERIFRFAVPGDDWHVGRHVYTDEMQHRSISDLQVAFEEDLGHRVDNHGVSITVHAGATTASPLIAPPKELGETQAYTCEENCQGNDKEKRTGVIEYVHIARAHVLKVVRERFCLLQVQVCFVPIRSGQNVLL